MNGTRSLNTEHKLKRRLIAVVCVVCLAVLQCMVVLPAVTEDVHASNTLEVTAIYKDGAVARQSVDTGWVADKVKSRDIEIVDEEGEVIETLKGYTVQNIMKEMGITKDVSGSVVVGGYEVSWKDKNAMLVIDDGFQLYDGSEYVSSVDTMDIERSNSSITWSKKPESNKSSPSVGDTIKISYKFSVDKFYKESEDYDESRMDMTWTGNSKVKLLSTSSSGTSGSIKAKIKKAGSITITPEAVNDPELTDGVKVSFTGQTTTTTTKYTTRSAGGGGYSRYTGTTRSGTTAAGGQTTTATRPIETQNTLAPSFQTIAVKEVFLTPMAEDPTTQDDVVYYDENGNPIQGEDPEDESEEWDEDGVSIPAAAGSAAVAAAACGVGAVGRVRRFRHDMSSAALAAVAGKKAAAGKGRKTGSAGRAGAASAGTSGKSAAGASPGATSAGDEKAGRNPLKKLRRKS